MLRDNHRRRVTFSTVGDSMTKQSHKAECDINNIINKYQKTGIVLHVSSLNPVYADLPETMEYQDSLNMLMEAQAAFEALPSVVRRYFDNDPAQLLSAIHSGDPEMVARLTEFGIFDPKPTPQPPGNPANASLLPQGGAAPTLGPAPSSPPSSSGNGANGAPPAGAGGS